MGNAEKVFASVGAGCRTVPEIVEYSMRKGVPESSAYKVIDSLTEKWGYLSLIKTNASPKPLYVPHSPALEKLFTYFEHSSGEFGTEPVLNVREDVTEVLVETKANVPSPNCTVQLAVVDSIPKLKTPFRCTLDERKEFHLGEVRQYPIFLFFRQGDKMHPKFIIQDKVAPIKTASFVFLFTVNHTIGITMAPFLVMTNAPTEVKPIVEYVNRARHLTYDRSRMTWSLSQSRDFTSHPPL